MRALSWATASTAAITIGLSPIAAQAPREARLAPATATHPEPFGLVTTVRELADGRVVVADPLGRTLVILSPDLATQAPVGREGAGPGEYRQPDAVWPLPGDSTLVVDLGNSRLAVLAPSGTISRSFSMLLGRFRPETGRPPVTIIPGGTDAGGRVYFQTRTPGADSATVLRLDPEGEGVDTVAMVKLPAVEQQASGGQGRREMRVRPVPLSGSDGWAVSPNGAIAVVRVGDYHVEWIDAGGTERAGPPLALPRVRIGTREKEEWVERQQLTGGIGMAIEAVNGQVTLSLSRGRSNNRPNVREYSWPEFKPPFDASQVFVDPVGRVWVARQLPAGQAPLYDLFGSDGRHASSVRFPAGRRLVGFGGRGLYAAAVDQDGQHRLERYAMPL